MVIQFEDTCQTPMVEVLTNLNCTSTIGYRLGGFKAGPSVVVAGYAPVANLVYDRLIALPTIGWMHGTLTLVFLQAIENANFEVFLQAEAMQKPDELHVLPLQIAAPFQDAAIDEGYWSTLRLCARLGMISGRGIPKVLALSEQV